MAKQKASVPLAHRERLPDDVKVSWLPAGMSASSVLAGQGWKPAVNEVRCFEITGFQTKIGEFEGRKTEYSLLTCVDLQTGEEFVFAPGGLIAYLFENETLKTGSKIGAKFLGMQTLKSGRRANGWEVVTLKD